MFVCWPEVGDVDAFAAHVPEKFPYKVHAPKELVPAVPVKLN